MISMNQAAFYASSQLILTQGLRNGVNPHFTDEKVMAPCKITQLVSKWLSLANTDLEEFWRPELFVVTEELNLIQNHFTYNAVKKSHRVILIYKTRRHVSRDLQR